jgi:hypothetical protein
LVLHVVNGNVGVEERLPDSEGAPERSVCKITCQFLNNSNPRTRNLGCQKNIGFPI